VDALDHRGFAHARVLDDPLDGIPPPWFLKYRFTYPTTLKQNTERELDAFMVELNSR
jgi:hypothetical protein